MCHAKPLFERLGGFSALAEASGIFYSKISKDTFLLNIFCDVDVGRQSQKSLCYIAWAFKGPAELCGPDLRTIHSRLEQSQSLRDTHYEAITGHLISTLQDMRIDAVLIDEVVANINAARRDLA